MLDGADDPILAIVVFTALLFFLPSLFVGTVSPILTRLAVLELPERPGAAIGQMFALGAVGSIAGTLLAGYLFLSWIGTTWTVVTVAGSYLALALGFALAARLRAGEGGGPLAAVTGAALLAVIVPSQRLAAFTPPCLAETDYYCINAVDFTAEAGRPRQADGDRPHGARDQRPRRSHGAALLLHRPDRRSAGRPPRGGRAGRRAASTRCSSAAAPTPCRAPGRPRYPAARQTVVEIDPAVTRVAEARFWFDPRGHRDPAPRRAGGAERHAAAAAPST